MGRAAASKSLSGSPGAAMCWPGVLSDAATTPEKMNDKENHSQDDEQVDKASR